MSAALQTTHEPAKGVHHNRDFVLQKYLLLEEQHESLRQHLDQLRPTAALGTSPTTSPICYPSSATSASTYTYWPQPQSRRHSRSSSIGSSSAGFGSPPQRRRTLPAVAIAGLEPVPDETTLHEVAEEEAKLCGVNEGIKRALTELLNCEAVRADRPLRTWVQCRLMETEKELRTGRRRRSAPGVEH